MAESKPKSKKTKAVVKTKSSGSSKVTVKKSTSSKPKKPQTKSKKITVKETKSESKKTTKKASSTKKPKKIIVASTSKSETVKTRSKKKVAPKKTKPKKKQTLKKPKESTPAAVPDIQSKQRKNSRLLLGIFVFFLAATLGFAFANSNTLESPGSKDDLVEQQPAPRTTSTIEGRYLLTGTTVWDRGVELSSGADLSYPFSGLDTFNRDQYDAWVTDLECPISADDIPYEVGVESLQFNCRPDFLPYAAEYFDFYNLANNHSSDGGQAKLQETKDNLALGNLTYFGDPDPANTDETCEIVALPVREVLSSSEGQTSEERRLPIAFCAWHYFFRRPRAGELEVIEKYAELMPVFAFVHMGVEYEPESDGFQKDTARELIDLGADFVIANNPHWVQEAEVYNDKLIVYSTGNFIFDQRRNQEVRTSASIDVSFQLESDIDVEQWLRLGPSCTVHADSCLQSAIDQGLAPLELDYVFDVVAGTNTTNAPVRADDEIQAFVEDRMNWDEVISTLQPTN